MGNSQSCIHVFIVHEICKLNRSFIWFLQQVHPVITLSTGLDILWLLTAFSLCCRWCISLTYYINKIYSVIHLITSKKVSKLFRQAFIYIYKDDGCCQCFTCLSFVERDPQNHCHLTGPPTQSAEKR